MALNSICPADASWNQFVACEMGFDRGASFLYLKQNSYLSNKPLAPKTIITGPRKRLRPEHPSRTETRDPRRAPWILGPNSREHSKTDPPFPVFRFRGTFHLA